MKFPNKYLRNLKPYKLASHRIWQISAEERNGVLKLDWNEATVPPSPLVRTAIEKLLAEPCFFNLYPATNNLELSALLSKYVGLPEENIQYFSSSDVLHEYICKVFMSVGDPVLILGPSYDNFRLTCQANGSNVHFFKYSEDFTFDSEGFKSSIQTIEPAVVYICNPNNPTGNCHSEEYIESLLTDFPDTLFLIDEAYYEFAGITCKNLVLKYENILISRTMSKAFAIANFRIGYLIASKDNVQFINRVRNPKNVSTISQAAAVSVLSDINYMKEYVNEVLTAREDFRESLAVFKNHLSVFPSKGNFLLMKFNSYEEKTAMLEFLARKNIFVRDTTQDPILQNCFRVTMGTRNQMQRVLLEMETFYKNI